MTHSHRTPSSVWPTKYGFSSVLLVWHEVELCTSTNLNFWQVNVSQEAICLEVPLQNGNNKTKSCLGYETMMCILYLSKCRFHFIEPKQDWWLHSSSKVISIYLQAYILCHIYRNYTSLTYLFSIPFHSTINGATLIIIKQQMYLPYMGF